MFVLVQSHLWLLQRIREHFPRFIQRHRRQFSHLFFRRVSFLERWLATRRDWVVTRMAPLVRFRNQSTSARIRSLPTDRFVVGIVEDQEPSFL